MTEIELKARVQNSDAVQLILTEKAEYKNAFIKEDSYWLSEIVQTGTPQKVRVRRETRTFPNGCTESVALVTCKTKKVRDGIEINDELEFEVIQIEAFEEFLKKMGLKPAETKRKQGRVFSWEGVSAELCEVEGLGRFIELEILADNSREETVAEGRKRLIGLLAEIGIEKEAIESRYYTDMLREKRAEK